MSQTAYRSREASHPATFVPGDFLTPVDIAAGVKRMRAPEPTDQFQLDIVEGLDGDRDWDWDACAPVENPTAAAPTYVEGGPENLGTRTRGTLTIPLAQSANIENIFYDSTFFAIIKDSTNEETPVSCCRLTPTSKRIVANYIRYWDINAA